MNFKIQNLNREKHWIDDFIKSRNKFNYVNGIIPNLYTHFYKLFLPIGLKNDNEIIEQIKYKDLAELAGIEFTNNFSFTNIIKKFGGLPSNLEVLKDKDIFFINELIKILGKTENTVFEGYGDDVLPEVFQLPYTIEATLDVLPEIFKNLNIDNYLEFNHFPNLIYSSSKSWCINTRIFQSGLLILGCDISIAEKIRNQNTIEYVELGYDEEYFVFLKY